MLNNSLDSFNFSFKMVKETKKELQSTYDTLNDRIEKILDSENFFISNLPVLRSIMGLSPSSEELKKLAKALDRLADLNDAFSQISKKMDVINGITQDPDWFTWAFGDFARDVDDAIQTMFKDTGN